MRIILNSGAIVALLVMAVAATASAQTVAVLSSASYGPTVAAGSAAAAFGFELSVEPTLAFVDANGMLPRQLAGVTISIDGLASQIAYVSSTQINFVVPHRAAEGSVDVVVSVEGRVVANGSAQVARVIPGIFSADGSGSGAASALNFATGGVAPFPNQTAEFPGCDKRTRVKLFATGILYAGNPDRLPAGRTATEVEMELTDPAGGTYRVPVEFVGAIETYPAVDEVRFALPDEASAFKSLQVRIFAEGIASNAVTLAIFPTEAANLNCEDYGSAFVYNTVADLLAGDLWDTSSRTEVFGDLAGVPGDWELSGVGTTALNARNGELIGAGFAGAPEVVWSDPEFPPTVRTLTDEPIAFLGIGAGNPASVVIAQATPDVPIHQQVVELAAAHSLAFAAVRVSGRFAPVSYSVAHSLLKSGTPLTDPTVDKAPFQLFFTADQPAEWELSGFYAAASSVQKLISVPGAPLHLHGFQLDRARAGHVGSAVVANAEIRLYPLAPPTVREVDLTLQNVVFGGGGVMFEVLNAGTGTVARTTVQGLVKGTVVFQVELSALGSRQARMIVADLPDGVATSELQIVADPFNDVFESDESNNRFFSVKPSAP